MSATMLSKSQQEVVDMLLSLPGSRTVDISTAHHQYVRTGGVKSTQTTVEISGGFDLRDNPSCKTCGHVLPRAWLGVTFRWKNGRYQTVTYSGKHVFIRKGTLTAAIMGVRRTAELAIKEQPK